MAAGFADYVEVADGTTVQSLFAERVPHGKPQDYLIRVNRQPVAADQVLVEGDRISSPRPKSKASWRSPRPRRREGLPVLHLGHSAGPPLST